MSHSVHQEVSFSASPAAVYEALMSSEQHAAFTGGVSSISREVGGAFSGHDGQIVGRHIELDPGVRIIQAWRVGAWPEGIYSIVRYELRAADGGGTTLVLDHTGLPDGASDLIAGGWEARYWTPMKAHFAG